MAKSLNDWLQEGETLYQEALKEYQDIEKQLDELEARLAAKKDEVNQIASVIGKPAVDGVGRKAAVQIVEPNAPGSIPASRSTIAKAITGRVLGGA